MDEDYNNYGALFQRNINKNWKREALFVKMNASFEGN